MPSINPYLFFKDSCEEAFQFYRSVFGGDFLVLLRYGDHVEHLDSEPQYPERVMHVALPMGKHNILMGSDHPDDEAAASSGFSENLQIFATVDTKEEADRVYNALAEGGEPGMPMADVFWGAYFGSLKDKFGVNWMVSFEYPTE